jgi:DNA-binding NarL/FixJ family response regulator
MMPIMDISDFPIVRLRFGAAFQVEDVDPHAERVEALFFERGPMLFISDLTLIEFSKVPVAARKRLAEHADRLAAAGAFMAEFVIVNNTVAQGLFNGLRIDATAQKAPNARFYLARQSRARGKGVDACAQRGPRDDFLVLRLPRPRDTLIVFIRKLGRFKLVDVTRLSVFFLEAAVRLGAPPLDDILPRRLLPVLRGLVLGESLNRIARNLALSPHTVDGYRKELFAWFCVHSRNELVCSPAVRAYAQAWMTRASTPSVSSLSAAAAATLYFLCCGLSEKEVALQLGCSEPSVHAHTKRLYRKFDVSSRAQLIARYYCLPASQRANLWASDGAGVQ